MIFRHFRPPYQKLFFLFFAGLLPLVASSTTDEGIKEKRTKVAMRMIGHQVLLCMGDSESRVMPIEKIGDYYKISFESAIGLDPDDLVSIVERVMRESEVASHYLVEVQQCETREIVHAFAIGNPALIPCEGRMQPEGCYTLLITIWDDILQASASDNSSISPASVSGKKTSAGALNATRNNPQNPLAAAFLIIPLLILIGFIGYFKNKRGHVHTDPNLISIGASQFDKRKMTLSFADKSVDLSNKETELLALLHASANAPLERELILRKVWGDEGDYVGRTLDVFISKLRKKLEADNSVKIVNIRGVGYKLVMDVAE